MLRTVGRKLALVIVLGALVLAGACGDGGGEGGDAAAPDLAQPEETGRELAVEFLTLLQEMDPEGLAEFLSDAWIIQRADGSYLMKDEYLDQIPEIREFEIPDVTAVQAGGVLTVRWELEVDETIGGSQFASEAAPRLSTFAWDGEAERWRMTSHANFNVPAR